MYELVYRIIKMAQNKINEMYRISITAIQILMYSFTVSDTVLLNILKNKFTHVLKKMFVKEF